MTEKKITEICFADDSGVCKGEENYTFWYNFDNRIDIKVWGSKCPKIYNYSKNYNSLPDPDANSRNLYEKHIQIWNKQYKNKLQDIKDNIKDIERNGNCKCELMTQDKEIILGSDSIMSIYWHRNSGKMPSVMKEIYSCIEDEEKHREYCSDIKEKKYKEFIKQYLERANTIGGFIVFPKHGCSLNQKRGCSSKIQDRFDLTLECIRRGYISGVFDDDSDDNPLFAMSDVDRDFFKMFGSFKNYINFFCLNSWVDENYEVKDLLSDNGNSLLPKDEWPQEILPCDFAKEDERVRRWLNLYKNLMKRLDDRNKAIQDLFLEEK